MKNTLLVRRDNEEDFPGWVKNVIHLKVALEEEHMLQAQPRQPERFILDWLDSVALQSNILLRIQLSDLL